MAISSDERRVVVTGLGAVASLGHSVGDLWASLLAGRSGVRRVSLFDPSPYASQIGAEVTDWDAALHMDPKEARRNDRYTHFGLVAAKQAFADAGLDMTREDADRVGVMIGSGIGGMFTYESQLKVLAEGLAVHDTVADRQHLLGVVRDRDRRAWTQFRRGFRMRDRHACLG